jgi:hypothetical protein
MDRQSHVVQRNGGVSDDLKIGLNLACQLFRVKQIEHGWLVIFGERR